MKIFSAAQIKSWDAFTIANEPIAAVNLMERAATACYHWLVENNMLQQLVYIFCGKGNNGGDGLAIARLLIQHKCKPRIFILETGNKGSAGFETNLEKLHKLTLDIRQVSGTGTFPLIPKDVLVIDALFGTGLHTSLQGNVALLVNYINHSGVPIISIDMPSGMYADHTSTGNTMITALHTLSFQHYKLAFLLAENENYCGEVHILDIRLHHQFEKDENAVYELVDPAMIYSLYKPRKKFTHKGTYGHAALIAGSYGMMGAAVLSAKGCLRSGVGKLSCYIPKCGYQVLQITVPEAMCIVNGEDHITTINETSSFDAVGIGPGMGVFDTHVNLLKQVFLASACSVVIDADSLNVLAQNKTLLADIPPNSILTPHPKEFEKLFGKSANEFDRLQLALEQSKAYHIYIVLKGHFSFISTPEGKGYFNSTGNAGMATAGSGDVLTGIITGLLAQAYTPLQACLLGVYLHGIAGDIAAFENSPEALVAGDITEYLGAAYKAIL